MSFIFLLGLLLCVAISSGIQIREMGYIDAKELILAVIIYFIVRALLITPLTQITG